MLPLYVLFSARKTPQASTGFTTFVLLVESQPRGLLDIAKDAWDEHHISFRSVIKYMWDMQDKITAVLPIVGDHLSRAQKM